MIPGCTYRSSCYINKTVVVVLVMVPVGTHIYVVDPDVCGVFDRDCIFEGCKYLLMHCVPDDDVGRVHDREANANNFCNISALITVDMAGYGLLPLRPMIDLLLPTNTFFAPVIVPDTTTMRGSFPVTALSRAARVDTVTVGPPLPPDVLCIVSDMYNVCSDANAPGA